MKAIVQDTYGSAEDVLKLDEIDAPVAKDDAVLGRCPGGRRPSR